MDYENQQKDEMEALQSIFMDEFILLNESPLTYELIILADMQSTEEENAIKARVRIEYPAAYPNELPSITVHVEHPLTIRDLEKLTQISDETCKYSIGMPMIYEVTEKMKDYLISRKDQAKTEEIEEEKLKAELKKAETENKYKKSFKIDHEITTFTPVTLENYKKWRESFDKQIEEEAQKAKSMTDKKTATAADDMVKRQTGRQIFEQRRIQKKKTGDQKEEDKDGKEEDEVFYYDEEAYEDLGDVENVDLS